MGFPPAQDEALDPALALQQEALRADAAVAASTAIDSRGGPATEAADTVEEDVDWEALAALASEPDEPLPASFAEFRKRARINTYTVIGPEFAIDDYPGAEGRLDEYPITFGVQYHRVRTLG